jgi:aquaporin Z
MRKGAISLTPKLVTEFVGTFIFLSTIALSGAAGPLAPIAIGSALMVMVYMGGHISGGHYNPAVSLGAFLRGAIDALTMVSYWVVQLVAGVLAFVFGYLVSGKTPGIHPGPHVYGVSALAIETLFTLALVLVVLNVATTMATEGNSFYGLAIGFTVVVAAFAGGPISGGAFNPAVGFGATLGAALFQGGSWSSLWLYIVGPLLGGAMGAGLFHLQGWLPGAAEAQRASPRPRVHPGAPGSPVGSGG